MGVSATSVGDEKGVLICAWFFFFFFFGKRGGGITLFMRGLETYSLCLFARRLFL